MTENPKQRLEADLHDFAAVMRETANMVDKLARQIGNGQITVEEAREIAIDHQMWDLARVLTQDE